SLAQRGFTPALCARTIGGVPERDYIEMLLDHQVSGVVFAGGSYALADSDHGHYRQLMDRRMPVVMVNAGADDLGFPHISTDDAVAVEQAYGHLRTLGHTRIGMVMGPEDHVPSRRKLAAVAEFANWRSEDDWLVERTTFSMESARVAAARLIQRSVTGMICASDVLALGSIRAARRLGLEVPRDVSVVGFDDSALMTCTDPPLTTVRQPIEMMGQAAVDLLVNQIEGSGVAADELLFEPELVVRGSTAPVPAG
ncbi:MAG TPA: substrate-binding domain-containing protein, partial [Kribbella sp.]